MNVYVCYREKDGISLSNTTLVMTEREIEQLIERYQSNKIERNAPGVRFCFKVGTVTVTIYNSKKVLFQGGGAAEFAQQFGSPNAPSTKRPSKKTTGTHLPDHLAKLSVIGSDETGTGDYFGPITVTACFVPASEIGWVTEYGVKDSKMLTDDLMRQMAPALKESLIHSTLVLPNPKYNELQASGMSQGKMKGMMHNQALLHVLRKMDGASYDYILIDQFAEASTYYRYLSDVPTVVNERVLFATKAEQIHVSVAAASILARVAFLEEIDRLSEIAGVTIPKGASSKVDQVAAHIWKQRGEDVLRSMTKWHFANTLKAKKKLT